MANSISLSLASQTEKVHETNILPNFFIISIRPYHLYVLNDTLFEIDIFEVKQTNFVGKG